jgi:3',5'-cyclic AMP phosphodiesterase CpdA
MFSFDYGNSHWTILDSNEYIDWSDEQLRSWVKADLEKASGKQWRFVAYHHPGFHSSKKHQSQKQMRHLQDIFEDGKVDVVFSGHVHNYQRSYPIQSDTKRGLKLDALLGDDWKVDRTFDGRHNKKPQGVIYVVNGAGGAYLYNPELSSSSSQLLPFQQVYSSTFSFGKLTVNNKSLSYEQVDHSGKLIDSFRIDK